MVTEYMVDESNRKMRHITKIKKSGSIGQSSLVKQKQIIKYAVHEYEKCVRKIKSS